MTADKLSWQGKIISVQPRIRLSRSFDQRSHSYLGYAIIIDGIIDEEKREFSVGIGKAAQAKHEFRVNDKISGLSHPVQDKRMEPVEFYKCSKIKVLKHSEEKEKPPPPWHGIPPDLQTYRERGHLRLAARTYKANCQSCKWGCRMPVEMIIDHWNPSHKRYRFETFCYGPKSCKLYKSGLCLVKISSLNIFRYL